MIAPDDTTPTPVLLTRWGNGDTLEPAADFEKAVSLDSSVITYEFGVQMFDLYGERSSQTTVESALAIGKQIRFDLVAGSKNSSGYGWRAFNTMTNKYINAENMQLWELYGAVPPVGDCDGSWGYWPEDLNQDCIVSLPDFGAVASDWLEVGDTL